MANISNNAYRSRLAQNNLNRGGAAGFHHNPQAFDHLVGTRTSTKQCYLRKNWHYMTEARQRFADRLSTNFMTYRGSSVPVDTKSGQFGLALS